jgi:hypothetical protein
MTQDERHQLLCGLWFSGKKKRQHQQEEKKAEGCSKHEPTESDGGRLMLTGRIPIGPGDEKPQALGPLCVCVVWLLALADPTKPDIVDLVGLVT